MSSATDQLQRLEEAVAFAKGREDAVLAARSRASRAVSAAEGALALYHEAVGAGEDEDPAEEEHLRLAVRDAREQGEPPVWNAKLGGALRAREDAERERDAYGREHFGEIAAEQAPLDPPVAERLQAAWEELRAARAPTPTGSGCGRGSCSTATSPRRMCRACPRAAIRTRCAAASRLASKSRPRGRSTVLRFLFDLGTKSSALQKDVMPDTNRDDFDALGDQADAQGGAVTVSAETLRDAHGAGRLGVHVRSNISRELQSRGLAHYPDPLPDAQGARVRVYRQGSDAARVIGAVLNPSTQSDEIIRELVGGEAPATLEKIKELVCS